MRENKYDDPIFFEKYGQMDRSRLGLTGAAEWEALEPLLPDLRGKRVVDLGCGYGWHCAYAAEHGAAQVLGIVLSERMLAVARQRHSGLVIAYRRCAMEDVALPDESVDLVFSSLALHYVQDFGALLDRIWRWLTPGGRLLFSVEHPIFTAYGSQDWYRDGEGRILHFPVDRYCEEGARTANCLGEDVVKYHRTLTTYLDGLLRRGFRLLRVVEPQPPARMLELPGMRDELRRPMMLLVSAEKPLPDRLGEDRE